MAKTKKPKKTNARKHLNTLIPMENPDGGRSFVNHWDVPDREADGWTVVGDVKQHVATVRAPVEALDPENDPSPAAGGDGKSDADDGKQPAKKGGRRKKGESGSSDADGDTAGGDGKSES